MDDSADDNTASVLRLDFNITSTITLAESTNHNPSTTAKQHYLTTIPAELRNAIYSYALPCETQEISHESTTPVFPLFHVNRAMRKEVAGLYYSTCKFETMIRHRSTAPFLQWLRRLPSSARKALRQDTNVNLRVFFDRYQYPHFGFQNQLSNVVRVYRSPAWFISAGSCEYEREGLEKLMDLDGARAARETEEAREVRRLRGELRFEQVGSLGLPEVRAMHCDDRFEDAADTRSREWLWEQQGAKPHRVLLMGELKAVMKEVQAESRGM